MKTFLAAVILLCGVVAWVRADDTQPEKSGKPAAAAPFENSLGMKFVPVKGSEVLFSIWDTRVQDFEAFVKATGYNATKEMYSNKDGEWGQHGDTWRSPGFKQGPTHPVCGVNWDDAKAFCKWLTETERKAGKITAQQEYRLPTEKEWTVAVGTTKYPWGDQWPPPKGAGNYAESLHVDDFPNTSPVGSFPANPFGLYDMSGNVWQWCEDLYAPDQPWRVLRGGVMVRCLFRLPCLLASLLRL